jgi:hypothetical protein
MRRLVIFLGLMLALVPNAGVWAACAKAVALRQANGLVEFTPSDKFLSANFVADEMEPAFVFGPVKAFAASLKCPTTWLMKRPKTSGGGGQQRHTHGVHRLPGGGLPGQGDLLRLH